MYMCAKTQHVVNHYGYRYKHYGDVIMGTLACEITSLTIVYFIAYSDADQRKHQSYATPGTGEFPVQMASYTENVSIWWRHHDENVLHTTR